VRQIADIADFYQIVFRYGHGPAPIYPRRYKKTANER